ncbi:hypothetical protein ABEY04_30645 [Bacillus mycoides]|uniref:hypothetical protein n=1 Tax=Bacillus mycoides TaxID=1405 RepID=UPI003D24B02F
MERVQAIIDSNLKFKSWVKQVLAIGGILGFFYLVLYVLCFLFVVSEVNFFGDTPKY